MLIGIPLARMACVALVVPNPNPSLIAKPDYIVSDANLKYAVVLLIKRNKFDMSTGYGKLFVLVKYGDMFALGLVKDENPVI